MQYVAAAAFIGGLLSALLGWLDSQEPFNGRKFTRSVIASALAALGFALAYSSDGAVTVRDIFTAVLAGAGVDVISNRALALRWGRKLSQ